jgi:hypothetical protein
MSRTKSYTYIEGLPVVVNEAWPDDLVPCLDRTHKFNETGGLELQCNQVTYDLLASDPIKVGVIAGMVRIIKKGIRLQAALNN